MILTFAQHQYFSSKHVLMIAGALENRLKHPKVKFLNTQMNF